MNRIIVVGAGPAGIFAALFAKTADNQVLLLERNNRIGRKLSITGKGRCNITNAADISEFFEQINRNGRFLYSALYSYTNRDLMEFLGAQGLEMKVERGGRVFPTSDRALDVIDVLDKSLRKKGVDLRLETTVKGIQYEGGVFRLKTNHGDLEGDRLILATGGVSYPKTGSDGQGLRFAANLGHSIREPRASLVPLVIEDEWVPKLQGLSLKNVELRLYQKDAFLSQEFGEMLFTHYGVSGPIVLTLSTRMKEQAGYRLELDLKPALTKQQLDKRILRDFEKYQNKQIKNALGDLTLQGLVPILLRLAAIDGDTFVHQITKEEREALGRVFKAIPMQVTGFRPVSEAIVTAGGVDVSQINPKTMQSKEIPGLYFAGEMMDVDANTGGYNLQIAFSTGYTAGINAKEEKS
ncbi:MAG: NAD(P)/FAD-dependent oxidoreductase [Tissierellia bacterium]|nr:NAD(P)/FAD-dependent oxidoreductase [Tissierellia bacterium]